MRSATVCAIHRRVQPVTSNIQPRKDSTSNFEHSAQKIFKINDHTPRSRAQYIVHNHDFQRNLDSEVSCVLSRFHIRSCTRRCCASHRKTDRRGSTGNPARFIYPYIHIWKGKHRRPSEIHIYQSSFPGGFDILIRRKSKEGHQNPKGISTSRRGLEGQFRLNVQWTQLDTAGR